MGYDLLRKGRASIIKQAYFVTTTTHDRIPRFADLHIGRLVVQEMRRLHEAESVHSHAWVLMPDHLHWLFQLGELDLSTVMRTLKARSAWRINRVSGDSGRVWQRAYYDHALRREENLRDVARYIVANPLRAGIVSRLGDYPLWDANWL